MHRFGKRARTAVGLANRRRWMELMDGLATPVLRTAQAGELHRTFPEPASRLAAAAGVLCGLAPFLEAEPAAGSHALLAGARGLLADITSADGADSCRILPPEGSGTFGWANGLLAFALLRGRSCLLHADPAAEQQLLEYFENARQSRFRPDADGLLFRSMVELALYELSGTCDTQVLDYTMTFLMRQSRGNGVFALDNGYRWSYAHTFFLYPMAGLLTEYAPIWFGRKGEEWRRSIKQATERMSVIQARFLAPDGSFPVLGPEVWLRAGAFHTLAYAASREQLPRVLDGPAVREALLHLAERTLTPAGTVDADGFLLPGLCGHQPALCGPAVMRGQLYGCMAVFAPLGLPAHHDFWQNSEQKAPWDQMWTGENVPLDCDRH